jgi:Protein of unknown function (DUF3261)
VIARRAPFAIALLALACATTPPPAPAAPAMAADTGYLVPTDQLKGDFLVRQRLKGRYGERTLPAVDAVLQLHRGELTLVGLTPMGTRAFLLRQRGSAVTFQPFIDKLPPIDPQAILRDIHRVFFRGLFVGQPAPRDGEHQGQDHGEALTELWQSGRLRQRTYPGPVTITFTGDGAIIAPQISLANERVGYTLEITTSDQQRL